MTFFQAIFLAIVQGLTEFLPVSSSGHLVLFQKLFGVVDPPVLFDVLLHLGTLVAIIIFFWRDIFSLVSNWKSQKKTWLFLIVGSIPAAVFGFFLNSKIGQVFDSLVLLGIMWIIFGTMLVGLFVFKFKNNGPKKDESKVSAIDGLIVGFFQAFALFPGISRSGSTIIGGLWRNFTKETAFKLSFLLSIPAIFGAAVLKLKDNTLNWINIPLGISAILISAVVGYFSLIFLQKILKSNKFYYFGFYCVIIGMIAIFLSVYI